MSNQKSVVWIKSASFDLTWIVGPHFFSVFFAVSIYPIVKDWQPMPLWIWFVLVVCIDVAHVYSTLFRVYLEKTERQRYELIGWLIPLTVWLVGVLLYSLSPLVFWRCLAYLAVFHFIRQQYGFFRIYSGKTNVKNSSLIYKWLNQYSIYYVTVIPVLIWHFSGPKNFNWFIEDDFLYWNSQKAVAILSFILAFSTLGFVYTEFTDSFKNKFINWAKIGIYFGTLLVWYIGIVYFNNDIIFTITNVVAHGVPYMALIWSYKSRGERQYEFKWLKLNSFFIFIIVLLVLSYAEEFLWASLVWKEHLPAFFLAQTQTIEFSPMLLSLLVPLLAVPQGTHYILDAFIWKIKDSKRNQWLIEREEK